MADELVRRPRHEQLLGFVEQALAFGAIGQRALRGVEGVVGRQIEARVVGLPLVGAVAERKERVAVGLCGDPAHAPHHQLAGARIFQVLRPLGGLEVDPQADRGHALLPQFVELARQLIGLGGHLQQQRAAVGLLAPAVAIAVDVTEGIEQGACPRPRERAHVAAESGIKSGHRRRHRRVRGHRLALAHQPDFFVDVVCQRNRASQRDLLGRVAADQRMLHVEQRHVDVGARRAVHADAALAQAGGELAAGDHDVGEVVRDFVDQVVLLVQERKPARLVFLDDVDLHAVEHRQLAAAQRVGDLRAAFIAFGRRGCVKVVAIAGVALQHDPRRAAPVGQPERSGADRMPHQLLLVVHLAHFARDRAEKRVVGQIQVEAGRGLAEPDLQRVAVERAHAIDLAVVVERRALERGRAYFAHAQQLGAFEQIDARALVARVVDALDRVDVVLRGQLAPRALECRVVLEVDAGPDAHRQRGEVGRDLGHCGGGIGHHARRPRQKVVGQRRLEDIGDDIARVQVVDLRGVEAGLRHAKRVAQHLRSSGRIRLRQRTARAERRQQRRACRGLERRAPRPGHPVHRLHCT